MEKEDKMQHIPSPPLPGGFHLRDVRDVDGYVGEAVARIGVPRASGIFAALVDHGVDCVYRVERALPPETSLRVVLDDVLGERLERELRRRTKPPLAALAVA
jgi:hypothetical protein